MLPIVPRCPPGYSPLVTESAPRPLLSFITKCKGRLRHLKRTYRSVIAQGGDETEYVLTDYDDPEKSGDWLEAQNLPNVVVHRTGREGFEDFCWPKSNNVGAAHASGEFLAFLDCDVAIQPRFFKVFSPLLKKGTALVLDDRKDGGGFALVHRDDFKQCGGFDERFTGYGADDTDFLLSLDKVGVEVRTVPRRFLVSIQHPGSDRIRYMKGRPSLQEASDFNREVFLKKWGFPWHQEVFHELKRYPTPIETEFLTERGDAGLANPMVERMFRHKDAGAKAGGRMAHHLCLLHVLATQSPGPIVECGVSRGYSTMALLSGAVVKRTNMFSYDIDPRCERWARERIGPEGMKHLELVGGWTFKVAKSWEAAASWPDESIGLVFIDTSHMRDDTVRELDAFLPKLMPSGILCGHDYYVHDEPGYGHMMVKDPVDAFARKHRDRFDLQIFPHDCGFFVLWPRL